MIQKMVIDIDKTLKERMIEFCDDELNYHINESGCAESYHGETLAEIELLFLLGKPDWAMEYANDYGNEILHDVDKQKELHTVLDKYEK